MSEGTKAAPQDGLPPDLEQECETWDWVRAAGVSAQELRMALQQRSALGQEQAKAAT
jgi:hypothetical protein